MGDYNLRKIDLLYKMYDEVDKMKNESNIYNILDEEFPISTDGFEQHNYNVFKINLHVLVKLYKEEYDEFRKTHDFFGMNEYLDFVESLDLPPRISEIYMKMPESLNNRRILSYITDMPSFMGIIKD